MTLNTSNSSNLEQLALKGLRTPSRTLLPDCRFVYRSEVAANGSFTSPNFPGLYPRHTHCHYLFFGAADQRVFISFQYFDVEGISPGYVSNRPTSSLLERPNDGHI